MWFCVLSNSFERKIRIGICKSEGDNKFFPLWCVWSKHSVCVFSAYCCLLSWSTWHQPDSKTHGKTLFISTLPSILVQFKLTAFLIYEKMKGMETIENIVLVCGNIQIMTKVIILGCIYILYSWNYWPCWYKIKI